MDTLGIRDFFPPLTHNLWKYYPKRRNYMFDKYAKAVIGAVVAGATVVVAALSDGVVTTNEILALVTATAGSFSVVWAVPYSLYLKAVAGAAAAGGAALLAAYADGVVSGNEWYGVLAAVVAGFAVYQQKNKDQSPA